MKKKVNLYWFKKKPNVGDAASPYIISELFGYKVLFREPRWSFRKGIQLWAKRLICHCVLEWEYVPPFQRCLFAIGSILDFSNKKCDVWGTGFREYDSIFKGGEVFAVRGYLSRKILPLEYQNIPVGDPALLLPLVIKKKKKRISKETQIAIIPHYCDIESLSKKYSNEFDILDVRTEDVEGFITQLCQYDYILSSSLHGIIISHAYGIPAIWIYNNYINSGPFKFHDYFSSVNIPCYDGFSNLDEILTSKRSCLSFFLNHINISLPGYDIKKIQKELIQAFPYNCQYVSSRLDFKDNLI